MSTAGLALAIGESLVDTAYQREVFVVSGPSASSLMNPARVKLAAKVRL